MKIIFAVLSVVVTYAAGHLICGSDEEYLIRGPGCEPTCGSFSPASQLDADMAVGGCYCAAGKVRQESTGLCVDKECCKCGAGEIRNSRGNCVSAGGPDSRPCTEGRIRDNKGRCKVNVPLDISVGIGDKPCAAGEEYRQCGPVIQPTCDVPRPVLLRSRSGCRSGCFCKPGSLRKGRNGKCVAPARC